MIQEYKDDTQRKINEMIREKLNLPKNVYIESADVTIIANEFSKISLTVMVID